MSNEYELHTQPSFIISRIGALHIHIRKECAKFFRQMSFPVEMDQIPVLALLYYADGLSQQQICSSLLRDKASVARTVSFFSKKDIVKVVQDATDKRKTRVDLTAKGKELARKADAVIRNFEGMLTSKLTEKETIQFNTTINKLIGTTSTQNLP